VQLFCVVTTLRSIEKAGERTRLDPLVKREPLGIARKTQHSPGRLQQAAGYLTLHQDRTIPQRFL